MSIFCCLGKASANIAILSLSPDSSTSATSSLNAAMFLVSGAITLAMFSRPRTMTNSSWRKWSLVGALNAAPITLFRISSLTSRPEKSRYVRRFSNKTSECLLHNIESNFNAIGRADLILKGGYEKSLLREALL